MKKQLFGDNARRFPYWITGLTIADWLIIFILRWCLPTHLVMHPTPFAVVFDILLMLLGAMLMWLESIRERSNTAISTSWGYVLLLFDVVLLIWFMAITPAMFYGRPIILR